MRRSVMIIQLDRFNAWSEARPRSHSASMLSFSSWHAFQSSFPAYFELVNTIVPGPQSISYFVPQVLLLICLLVPPSIISHDGLAVLAMPIILGTTIHAWIAMRGADVKSPLSIAHQTICRAYENRWIVKIL